MKTTGPTPAPRLRLAQDVERIAEAARPGAAGAADNVRVSLAARALARLRAPETPDAARIERLRSAIERGEHRIDREKLAQAILGEER